MLRSSCACWFTNACTAYHHGTSPSSVYLLRALNDVVNSVSASHVHPLLRTKNLQLISEAGINNDCNEAVKLPQSPQNRGLNMTFALLEHVSNGSIK